MFTQLRFKQFPASLLRESTTKVQIHWKVGGMKDVVQWCLLQSDSWHPWTLIPFSNPSSRLPGSPLPPGIQSIHAELSGIFFQVPTMCSAFDAKKGIKKLEDRRKSNSIDVACCHYHPTISRSPWCISTILCLSFFKQPPLLTYHFCQLVKKN